MSQIFAPLLQICCNGARTIIVFISKCFWVHAVEEV